MKTAIRQSRGITLLELLAVLAIAALLAGGGLHAWTGYQQALRLEQGARQLLDFLSRVQANADWRNETRTARLIRQGEYWCLNDAADDSAIKSCAEQDPRQFTRANKDISVSAFTSDTLTFYGLRNTAQAGHITLANAAGKLRLVISVRGRLRLCSEDRQVLAIPLC
ncbi:prepilin peptidase-dependent protein [Brenneria tiliae]|uniref:Prepilin peptidase-dependent protein n=1 Tax=Brenneria tiliae TaxID=2914984 RepID=A0ABT0MT66_9GAMM|nr:prepilin peptidase-dependent protein [Brenneria tiliae]MCL2892992.1 prepilin peptidase-dependent protein [Brenneria tiliae]MCL2896634.1 prepilin peptidase-dependent protein [Brenneria tiliae]MCL2901116.1 prepilin peptidase-dependent protein [Brenneria tiliae]